MGISAADLAILNHPHNYYNHPPTNIWKSIVTDSVGLAFALAIVILRCYTKLYVTKTRGWEDCKTVVTRERHICTKFSCADTTILALVCFIVLVSMNSTSAARYGAGRHTWDLPPEMYNGYLTVGDPYIIEVCG